MRNIQPVPIMTDTVTSIKCDCCSQVVSETDPYEFQEILSVDIHAGYASVLGDGNHYELDLCQACVKQLLGPYLKLKYNYITGE